MARIAMVSSEIAPLRGWGAGTYATLMTLALSRAGHEVHLFTDAPDAAARAPALFPGVRLHELRPVAGEAFDNAHQAYSLAAMRAVIDAHEAAPFDVIEFADVGAEGYFALRAREATGVLAGATIAIRTHQTNHMLRELNRWPWENRWFASLRAMERYCLRAADVLLAPSRQIISTLEREIPGATRRARLARNPFSADLLSSPDGAAEPEALPRVFFAGRLEHLKGVEVLVRAAVKVLDRGVAAGFVLIGADTFTAPGGVWMRPHLETLIPARHAAAFEFHSTQMPRTFVATELARATLCCLPSLEDNFPYGALECIAAGRALITTTGSGVSEILTHGHDALLVPPDNVVALADAIARGLSDSTLRAKLADHARATLARECDPGVVTRVYAELRPRTLPSPPRAAHAQTTAVIAATGPAERLEATLRSLRAQTLAPTRIIVVADAATLASLPAAGDTDTIEHTEGGPAGALNAGIAVAHTRRVLPLRAGDVLEPAFIERAVRAAGINPDAAAVTSLFAVVDEEDGSRRRTVLPLGLERDQLPVWNCGGPLGALLDRDAVLAVGGFDPAMEDLYEWDMWCALANGGYRSVVIPEVLVVERRPPALTRRRAEMLRALMLAKHVGLSTNPELTMRMLVGEMLTDEDLDGRPDPRDIARSLIDENLRYRLADRLNATAAKLGVHDLLKSAAKSLDRGP